MDEFESAERSDGDGDGRTVVVVGAGPGLGSAVARRFAAAGDRVAVVARSRERLESLAADLRAETPGEAVAAPADVTDPEAVEAAFETVRAAFGPVEVLIDTLHGSGSGGVLETDLADLEAAWRVETAGAFLCARAAARDMVDGGGTILFTNSGAGKRAGDDLARSSARFGLRGLAASMARDLPPAVHVVHVTIDGWLGTPELRERFPDHPEDAWMDPDSVAGEYRRLVEQPADARSFDVDLRSSQDPVLAPWDGD